jgi:hypothetical protein
MTIAPEKLAGLIVLTARKHGIYASAVTPGSSGIVPATCSVEVLVSNGERGNQFDSLVRSMLRVDNETVDEDDDEEFGPGVKPIELTYEEEELKVLRTIMLDVGQRLGATSYFGSQTDAAAKGKGQPRFTGPNYIVVGGRGPDGSVAVGIYDLTAKARKGSHTPDCIRYRSAVYRRADISLDTAVVALQNLDRWFADVLGELYRDGTVEASYERPALWLRQLDEYLIVNHNERPERFESRMYEKLSKVYSSDFDRDVAVYLTDGGYSRLILPDEPGSLLFITPHHGGAGSTKSAVVRWDALVALAR